MSAAIEAGSRTAADKKLPVLSDHEAEMRLNRTENISLRCFLGLHRKAVTLWPAGDYPKVARDTVCRRCGALLQSELLIEAVRP